MSWRFPLLVAIAIWATPLIGHADAPTSLESIPAPPPQRDGRWLMNGITQYQRFTSKDSTQSVADANLAVAVLAYIRGTLDTLRDETMRGLIVEAINETAKASHDRKGNLSTTEIACNARASNYYAPLWSTGFYNTNMQIDQYAQIIMNFVKAHPKDWGKNAEVLVVAAITDAFPKKTISPVRELQKSLRGRH